MVAVKLCLFLGHLPWMITFSVWRTYLCLSRFSASKIFGHYQLIDFFDLKYILYLFFKFRSDSMHFIATELSAKCVSQDHPWPLLVVDINIIWLVVHKHLLEPSRGWGKQFYKYLWALFCLKRSCMLNNVNQSFLSLVSHGLVKSDW